MLINQWESLALSALSPVFGTGGGVSLLHNVLQR